MEARNLLAVLACAAAFSLAACHDDDDDGAVLPSGESLTRDLLVNGTSDVAEPIELNGLDLQFSEDPDAFADLLD